MNIITKCLTHEKPLFSWTLENCPDKCQKSYRICVFSCEESLIWDSGIVESDECVRVKYEGPALKESEKYFWRVAVTTEIGTYESELDYFITCLYDTKNLKWICADKSIWSPIIHKEFHLKEISDSAVLNICGLGFFEVYINDQKVSNHLMSPVRTDYADVEYLNPEFMHFSGVTRKRIEYLTYEIKDYLRKGNNKISVWLTGGWFKQDYACGGRLKYTHAPKLFFKIKNGTDIIESDTDCYATKSKLLYENIYYGEIFDARINSNEKLPVYETKISTDRIVKQHCPSEEIIETITPQKLDKVYDAGKVLTGFAEIEVDGNEGDEVEISYAECIDKNGELDYESTLLFEETVNIQIQKDKYILSGKETEKYHPRFLYHGFRYFKITHPESVRIKNIKVHYVCTAFEIKSKIETSNKSLNKIHDAFVNTLFSCSHGGGMVDCPHRERLIYTGDGQLTSQSVLYNFDAYNFYHKWIEDILDSQDLESGFVSHTAPFCGGAGGAGWGSAICVVPWNFYIHHGDTDILKKARPQIRKWLEFLSTCTEDGMVVKEHPKSWNLGEWCLPCDPPRFFIDPTKTDVIPDFVNTFYYVYCINIYEKISKVLGENIEDWILKEKDKSSSKLNELCSDGKYLTGKQGSNAFALSIGIVSEQNKAEVIDNMVKCVEDNGYRFDTGIMGTKFLLGALSEYDRNDIVLKMMLSREYPGFCYMLEHGATTMWETWEEHGGTSRNHIAFTSADAWFFYGLCGIKPMCGYKHFEIKPYFADELSFVNTKINTEYGSIALKWERVNDKIKVKITVPFNSIAHINLKENCFELKKGDYEYVI